MSRTYVTWRQLSSSTKRSGFEIFFYNALSCDKTTKDLLRSPIQTLRGDNKIQEADCGVRKQRCGRREKSFRSYLGRRYNLFDVGWCGNLVSHISDK
jgi:hypothetical protein